MLLATSECLIFFRFLFHQKVYKIHSESHFCLHGKKRSGCHRHKNIVRHNIVGSSNKIEERTISMDAFSKGNGGVSHSILLREILMYQP